MDVSSDSDDSAFLFSSNFAKRKASINARNKSKKLRLSSDDQSILIDGMLNEEEVEEKAQMENCESDSIPTNCSEDTSETLISQAEVSLLHEKHGREKDAEDEKLELGFSCPLCLKILNSKTTHFTHMKQCAKKSRMNAKQLLEALQLHKQHLKERLFAGLSNFPIKNKKVQIKEKNSDSAYQLAMALALSKSLEENNVSSKENQNCGINGSNEPTLERFGFTTSGRVQAPGKKSKNWKPNHSVLRERTREDREKLVTEKASLILLINDNAVPCEPKESLRFFHCKRLEETKNKDSHLWKLGEKIEESDWYVKELKGIIFEENAIVDKKEQDRSAIREDCLIDMKISKLNLPKRKISEDWRKLINNNHLSDMTFVSGDGERIYLHSIVLYVRCQKLLDSDLNAVFRKFENCTILKFLQYLYCGELNGLTREDVEKLLDLSKSLDYQELVDTLSSVKQFQFESEPKKNDLPENCEEISLRNANEREYATLSRSEERTSWNTAEDDNVSNVIEDLLGDSRQDEEAKESGVAEFKFGLQEESGKLINEESTSGNNEEKRHGLVQLDRSEVDMFEEEENLNREVGRNVENDFNPIAKDDFECIEISSGSTKSDVVKEESERLLPEVDYEIPYFDPYEHFNGDIPEIESFSPSEDLQSQSLIIGDISPVKSSTPERFVDDGSPGVSAPECSSTPNNQAMSECIPKECSRRLSMRSKLFGSKSREKTKIGNCSNEEDTEKAIGALTESILKELDNSLRLTLRKTPPTNEKSYMEVTPTVPGEEYIEDVTPIPDYSVMGASSIKKHLTKYGLKKSLSKNKAKKILRHIYEELHPIVNTKSGKIVKYVQREKSKKCKAKKKGRNDSSGKRSRGRGDGRTEAHSSRPKAPKSPETAMEEDAQSCTSMDSCDGTPGCSTLSDGSCFEVEELASQSNYSSESEVPTAVYDFIQSNQDIRRRILTYEPIWLEELQRKLFEKYNKKFKLTHLMDCLDAECITFRCESQRRANNRRK